MKCFYHTDMDGHCAGAIVYQYYKEKGQIVECLPINYKDDFPHERIRQNETVIIVDFSLQKPGDWEKLFEITKSVIWIDHHKTAIDSATEEVKRLQGSRFDGKAGCVLTWEYYHPKRDVPKIVSMLGDYDVWNFSKFGDALNILQSGIRLYDNTPESKYWEQWLSSWAFLEDVMNKGETALQYRAMTWAGQIKSWSFFAEFEGYKAVCCNAGSVSSQLFDSVTDDYDLMMPFVFDGKQWTVSIYSKKDIDCSVLAKKYGGGGHKKAAGFQCFELPFKRLK